MEERTIGRIVGPPGTGKTTEILRLMTAACQDYDPEKIGASSLTKAAVQEMRSRVVRAAGVEGKVNKNIRTMHSHGFNLLGLKKTAVAETHIDEWNESHPHYQLSHGSVARAAADAEETGSSIPSFKGSDATMKTFADVAMKRLRLIPTDKWAGFERDFYKEWSDWMYQNDYVDYTGMLEQILLQDLAPDIDILFIDEAQDMSPLQAKIAEVWSRNTRATIYAGDYQQAIFRFAGASPEVFRELPHTWPKELRQSYRVPLSVLNQAKKIISRTTDSEQFDYLPREGNEGSYLGLRTLPDLSLPGSHMIICRYKKQVSQWVEWLRRNGYLYKNDFRESERSWNPCSSKAWASGANYLKLMSGQNVNGRALGELIKNMKSKHNLTEKKEVVLHSISPRQEYNLFNISEVKGLDQTLITRKRDVTDLLLKSSVAALPLLKQNWECPASIIDGPKITVGTIHSVKGGEADNVWIESKIGKGYLRQIANSDKPEQTWNDEYRIAYVAVTRARQTLGFVTQSLGRGIVSPYYCI